MLLRLQATGTIASRSSNTYLARRPLACGRDEPCDVSLRAGPPCGQSRLNLGPGPPCVPRGHDGEGQASASAVADWAAAGSWVVRWCCSAGGARKGLRRVMPFARTTGWDVGGGRLGGASLWWHLVGGGKRVTRLEGERVKERLWRAPCRGWRVQCGVGGTIARGLLRRPQPLLRSRLEPSRGGSAWRPSLKIDRMRTAPARKR